MMPFKRGPRVPEASRPFRLWNAKKRKFFAFRNYSIKINAMKAALWLTKWMDIGTTIEVVDVRNMALHGQYTRRLKNVEFSGEKIKSLPKARS